MSEKENTLNQLEKKIETELSNFERDLGTVKDLNELEKIRTKYNGKKSFLINTLKNIGSLPDNIRPVAGKKSNTSRNKIESDLLQKEKFFKGIEYENKLKKVHIDLSLPGKSVRQGKKNIISQVIEEIEEIFIGMGFEIAEGPEVETDYYNFEALNTPADHPARSLHDTFFVSEHVVLRTHTSPVQVRTMEKQRPPVQIIVPGRAYRRDSDATHTPMFHQVEGLVVDEHITLADLKGTLEAFARAMFGADRRV